MNTAKDFELVSESDLRQRPPLSQVEIVRRRNWKSMLFVGILYCLLGALVIALPVVGTFAIQALVACAFIAGGIVHLIQAFRGDSFGEVALHALWGFLYAAGGVYLIAYPALGALALTVAVATIFLLEGALSAVLSIKLRPLPGWGWLALSAIASILLAGLIYLNLPSVAAWAIGLLVGLNLLTSGLAIVMLALASPSERQIPRIVT